MTITYQSTDSGCFNYNKELRLPVVKTLSCTREHDNKPQLFFDISGSISSEIIYHIKVGNIYPFANQKNQPKEELTKDDLSLIFEKMTIEILALRKYMESPMMPIIEVGLIIGKLELRMGSNLQNLKYDKNTRSYLVKKLQLTGELLEELTAAEFKKKIPIYGGATHRFRGLF